jgi:hypothetical protein
MTLGKTASIAFVLFALHLVGCMLPEEIDQRAEGLSTPSPAQRLADDPEFALLLEDLAAMARGHFVTGGALLPGEALLERADAISNAAEADAYVATQLHGDPARANLATGRVEALLHRHGLSHVTPDEVTGLFLEAFELFFIAVPLDGWVEYQLEALDEPIPEVSRECLQDCMRIFALEMAAAIKTALGALAACQLVPVPGNLICVAGAMASFAITSHSINRANDNCVAACEGLPPDSYCNDDADCAGTEYCDRGFIGIGANECLPLRREGQTCSRSGQCDTGCCRYRPLSNPFWPICRPASRCGP